jgi:hypothetical protein
MPEAAERHEAAISRAAKYGKDYSHADNGKVFNQGDADHHAAIGCNQLSGVAEQASEYHCARHRDCGADDDAPRTSWFRLRRLDQISIVSSENRIILVLKRQKHKDRASSVA